MKRIIIILLALVNMAYGQSGKVLLEAGKRLSIQDSIAAEYDSSLIRSVAMYGMLANVYDTRGKFLNTYKKLLAGSSIAGNTISRGKVRLRVAGFGDSVGGYAFNPFADLLYDMFGWGGGILSLSASTGGGSAHSNTNETTYWFNGNWFEINGSGSLTFLYGGGRVQSTQLKIYYIKESGAGSFQVQVDAGAGYANEGSVVDCDNATLESGVITINKSSGTYGIRINQVSGNVKIIMVVGINEPTDYDGVTMLQLNVGGLGWTAANSTSKAITRPVFSDLAIDLAFLEFKETGTIYSTFKQWADSFQAASPNTDWVLIGSTPQATNNADNISDNSALRLVAYQNNWFYYDGYSPFGSYAKLDSLGWDGDGIHPDYATGFYKAIHLWRIIGIGDILKLNRSWGVTYNGDQIFFRNRGLQFGGSNDNTYQGRIAGSTSSPDLYVYLKRWFSLLSTGGSTYTHYDPNTGWLIDANQNIRGYGWNSNGIMLKANDSLIDFWRATNRTYKMNIHARTGMFDSLYVGTGLGTTGSFPSSSALAEFNSSTKGLLIPRMNTTQMNAISSPSANLLVINTDSSRVMQYSSGAWRGIRFTNDPIHIDTTAISTRAWRQKGIDSLAAIPVHSEPTSRILLSNGSGGVTSDAGATIVSGVLSLGQSSYAGGTLKLVGDQAGSVTLNVRSSSSQDNYSINLPLVAGAAGETMVTNGSGNLEWQAVSSGTWTPTITNVANVTSSSSSSHLSYFRIGDRVFVTGAIGVQPTATGTTTTLRITLPISSAFDAAADCGGICGHNTGYIGTVTADTSNDEAVLTFIPTATTNTLVPFTFSYVIK